MEKKSRSHAAPKKCCSFGDLATGTADQVLMLCKEHPQKITNAVGMDLSEGMLEKGREKVRQQEFAKYHYTTNR